MEQLKQIAETLETINHKVVAHCINIWEPIEIGEIVTIKQSNFTWVAIITSIYTCSKFPGGIQPLGLIRTDLQSEYPEIAYIETKKMELAIITSIENGTIKKPITTPNPHSRVYEVAPEDLKSYLKSKIIIQSIATIILVHNNPEIIMFGLLNKLIKINDHLFTQDIVEQVLISIYQSSEGKTELIKRLCQTVENTDKNIQILF